MSLVKSIRDRQYHCSIYDCITEIPHDIQLIIRPHTYLCSQHLGICRHFGQMDWLGCAVSVRKLTIASVCQLPCLRKIYVHVCIRTTVYIILFMRLIYVYV